MYMYVHACTHHTHVCMHARAHTHTHTHTQTHTHQRSNQIQWRAWARWWWAINDVINNTERVAWSEDKRNHPHMCTWVYSIRCQPYLLSCDSWFSVPLFPVVSVISSSSLALPRGAELPMLSVSPFLRGRPSRGPSICDQARSEKLWAYVIVRVAKGVVKQDSRVVGYALYNVLRHLDIHNASTDARLVPIWGQWNWQ